MQDLVGFTLRSIVEDPDQVRINVVEGAASVLFEVEVSDRDRSRLLADESALLQSVQAVLSASSGRQKAVLDLIGRDGRSSEEE